MSENKIRHFELMRRALKDYNVETTLFPDFRTITPHKPAVWTYIDEPSSRAGRSTTALVDLAASPMFSLAFSVRYQLEVCISQGYLNEYNLNRDFITKLAEMEALDAQDLLEYVANQGRRVFDPMSVFNIKISQSLAMRASIPNYCVHTRSATITPTTMHFNTPTVDTSNRIIRQFSEYADRFLRIRFSDEMSEVRICFPCRDDDANPD